MIVQLMINQFFRKEKISQKNSSISGKQILQNCPLLDSIAVFSLCLGIEFFSLICSKEKLFELKFSLRVMHTSRSLYTQYQKENIWLLKTIINQEVAKQPIKIFLIFVAKKMELFN